MSTYQIVWCLMYVFTVGTFVTWSLNPKNRRLQYMFVGVYFTLMTMTVAPTVLGWLQ